MGTGRGDSPVRPSVVAKVSDFGKTLDGVGLSIANVRRCRVQRTGLGRLRFALEKHASGIDEVMISHITVANEDDGSKALGPERPLAMLTRWYRPRWLGGGTRRC